MQAPYLIVMLADFQSGDPALAGRLKAVAMQLLPPLLDALRVRRLFDALYTGQSAAHLEQRLAFSVLVRHGTASAGTGASELRLFLPHELT